MSRVLDDGEAGELLILSLPVALLGGIGVRSGDWVLVAAVVALALVFAAAVAVLWWWSNRALRPAPECRPAELLAIEPPKPVSPSAAGVFVVDAVAAGDGGASR